MLQSINVLSFRDTSLIIHVSQTQNSSAMPCTVTIIMQFAFIKYPFITFMSIIHSFASMLNVLL